MGSRRSPAPGEAHALGPPAIPDIDRMVEECLALGPDDAACRIALAVKAAVSEGRWQDAVVWQRVRLRRPTAAHGVGNQLCHRYSVTCDVKT